MTNEDNNQKGSDNPDETYDIQKELEKFLSGGQNNSLKGDNNPDEIYDDTKKGLSAFLLNEDSDNHQNENNRLCEENPNANLATSIPKKSCCEWLMDFIIPSNNLSQFNYDRRNTTVTLPNNRRRGQGF